MKQFLDKIICGIVLLMLIAVFSGCTGIPFLYSIFIALGLAALLYFINRCLEHANSTAAAPAKPSSPTPPPSKLQIKKFFPTYTPQELTDHVVDCGEMMLADLENYQLPESADPAFIVISYLYSVFNSFSIRFSVSVRDQYNEAIIRGLIRLSGLSEDQFLPVFNKCSSMHQLYTSVIFGDVKPSWQFDSDSVLPRQIAEPMWDLYFPEIPRGVLKLGLLPLSGMACLLNPGSCKPPYDLNDASLHVDSLLSEDYTPHGADSALYNVFCLPLFVIAQNNLFPMQE